MVNLVEAQKPLLHGLIKLAGLRQLTVEISPDTIMSFWVPKDKIPKKKSSTNKEIFPVGKTSGAYLINEGHHINSDGKKTMKPAVVLIHGFASEGIVTWQFQVGALTKQYSVYVPDLLFFGGSTTSSAVRSPEFQAECLTTALDRLGVASCTLVGFSYGGIVAFKMAEARPDLVKAMVVSGSITSMTDSISQDTMNRLGFSSSKDLLLPDTVAGLKALLKVSTFRKLWFPDRLYRDYLTVSLMNRNERAELLEGLIQRSDHSHSPKFSQPVLLLWGENDNVFNLELARNMKEELGENASLQSITRAGHLVHLERPCVYNGHLKNFLALVYSAATITAHND